MATPKRKTPTAKKSGGEPGSAGAAFIALSQGPAAVLNGDGSIAEVNGSFARLFEKTPARLRGRTMKGLIKGEKKRIGDALTAGAATELLVYLDGKAGSMELLLRLQPWAQRAGKTGGWLATLSPIGGDGIGDDTGNLDPLTGLPNRDLLRQRLEQVLRRDKAAAVLCVDIDNFDRINQSYGRAAGDVVLIETSKRISKSVRAYNPLGRMIEDAFIVILPDYGSAEHVNAVAQRLISAFALPFEVKGVADPLHLTACVGVAIAEGGDHDPDEMMENARRAAELAKQTGRGTYQFYRGSTKGQIRERRSRVNRLKRAIEQDELTLVYQPKMLLASGRIIGAEALVRWREPRKGTVMPGDFIPLAEDAGLIDPLGGTVMRKACAALNDWRAQGLPPMRLAVNVSAREIARRSFRDDLMRILDETGTDPASLEIEITESAIMEGAEDVISSLRKIRKTGVHLTADDFGTGYASLSYLQDFPLDGIKIDTSFVAAIDKAEDGGGLAAAVIAVGRCLGMIVVAEGVETEAQLAYLRWRDCDAVQGYLISPPVEADAFAALLRKDLES